MLNNAGQVAWICHQLQLKLQVKETFSTCSMHCLRRRDNWREHTFKTYLL